MKTKSEMNKHHRINVWRIANKCPACGEERGYSPANPHGIECYCSNDNCGYSEFFSNAFIHIDGTKNDNARFEVLGFNNKVRDGWYHPPSESERKLMDLHIQKRKQENERRERDKHKIYANCGNEIHCRKRDRTIKIKKCEGCSFCEELGVDESTLTFSKCMYPFA